MIVSLLIKNNTIVFNLQGGTQIRTGDRGFAIHCLTAWPYRHNYCLLYRIYNNILLYNLGYYVFRIEF